MNAEADVTVAADAAPGTPAAGRGLRIVRWTGYAVLAVQFVCFAAWSALLYHRFSLTFDFALYHQGWYEIAHGHLNPFNSQQGRPYWQDHGEFILWPLALLYWIPPHDVWLLWLQDAGVVIAEAVAFTWICELARKYRPARTDAIVLASLGLVLLVANPWTWWAVSFDFHIECIVVPFLALLARDLYNRRRRAWVWLVLLLACGDVAMAYLAAIGISAVLAGRRFRRQGLALVGIALAALVVLGAVHANGGTPVWDYAALENPPGQPYSLGAVLHGIVTNPRHPARLIWDFRTFTWQSLGASGLLGVGFLWVLPLTVAVVVADNLAGSAFSNPGFQSLALYILVPVGTVAVLGWLASKHRLRLVAAALACLVLVQALVLTAQWAPRTKDQWLLVPSGTAATLRGVLARIPASDEVIASQGVVGRFSSRTEVIGYVTRSRIPLTGARTWFVIVPDAGIETATPQEQMQLVSRLAGPMHATLVEHANGVWAYTWHPPRGDRQITLP